jgi:chemotaxis protein methyltransferase CheR
MALTSFFRDKDTLNLIEEYVMPDLRRSIYIRIWDAGCATGEEPFTLALILAEGLSPEAFSSVTILATDQEESNFPQFEKRLAEGIYHKTDIIWIPKPLFDKYFYPYEPPDYYQISDQIRSRVSYQKHDLLTLSPVGSNFDLVICKNVLLHFPPESRIEVLKMFHGSLRTNGFLAMESSQEMPAECEPLFRRLVRGGGLFQKLGAAT